MPCARARLSLVLAALLCLTSRVQAQAAAVGAQASAESDYEAALRQALEAHARGEHAAARSYMERAHALEPSARTLRGLGIVAFAQARYREAIVYLDAALSSAAKPLSTDLRLSVEELLGHAWAKVARYELLIEPTGGSFLIDGKEPDYYGPASVVLEPGGHTLTARAEGRAPYETTLEARAGEKQSLRVVLAPAAVPVVPQTAAQPSGPSVAARSPEAAPPAFWTRGVRTGAIVGGSALLLGAGALYTLGRLELSDLAESCRNTAAGGCTKAQAQRKFDARHIDTYAWSSAVLLGTGAAVLAAVGAIEVYRMRERQRGLSVGLGLSQVSVRGSF